MDAIILAVCAPCVGVVVLLLGLYLKKVGQRLYDRFSGAVGELVRIRKLLFMRGIVGFMAMGEAVEIHDGLLADFNFSGDEPSIDELDLLGLELEKRATGIKREILSLARDAQSVDEPVMILEEVRDSRIGVGNGFVFLGSFISLGGLMTYLFTGSLPASGTTYLFYALTGASALMSVWMGSRFIASIKKEKAFVNAMSDWESRYELGSKGLDDVVLYLLEQSKAFKGLENMISYKPHELSVLIEVCNRLSDVCATLGKYFDSKIQN